MSGNVDPVLQQGGVNIAKNNNDSLSDVRVTSIRTTKDLPRHLLLSLPGINSNSNITKDIIIKSIVPTNAQAINDDINNQTTNKTGIRATNKNIENKNTTTSSTLVYHSLPASVGLEADRRNLEASQSESSDSNGRHESQNKTTLSLSSRPESKEGSEEGSKVTAHKKLTVWQRIGLAPGLTGLFIVTVIIVYFVLWAGNQGEHCYLFLTILLAGFGNLGAGFILSQVQNWRVFIRVSELLVLEPTLLGLKGNIEMCMASRLSTQANMGNMDSWKSTFKMIRGNLALDLAQATTVATVASIGVVVFSLIQSSTHRDDFVYSLYIVLSSCLATACTASILLGKKYFVHSFFMLVLDIVVFTSRAHPFVSKIEPV
jgi:solute carrier family 41